MAWLIRQEGHKTALLVIELQRAMRGVEPIIWIGMAVEPCPPRQRTQLRSNLSVSGLSAKGVAPINRR